MPASDGFQVLSIHPDEPLKPYTTFKVGGPARHFVALGSIAEVGPALAFARDQKLPQFTLGGGSNILVSDRGFAGTMLHPVFRGIRPLHEDGESVTLEVYAGETWDNVVHYAEARGWWGIENLSHIPGQAGAALVQNIGAYGQQVGDVVQAARVVETATGAARTLSAADCALRYRQSIFNTTARGQLIIVVFTLRLAKISRHLLDYPDVSAYFHERGVRQPSLAEIRQAIVSIRDRKFPFPREERGGNAGSFFKNLSLNPAEYAALSERLKHNFSPAAVARLEAMRNRFPSADRIKVPTAFLLEVCGLKGHTIGGAQVNPAQPLVLLNQGSATAQDVLELARHVRRTVYQRTGAAIEIEPELVGFDRRELEYLYTLT